MTVLQVVEWLEPQNRVRLHIFEDETPFSFLAREVSAGIVEAVAFHSLGIG